MSTPGEWARRHARRDQLEIVYRLRWRFLAVATPAVALGVLAIVALGGTAVGLGVGAVWATLAWTIALMVLQVSGTTPRLMGADAELWSAHELATLSSEWSVIHGVMLENTDVDHVVIGPAGVFALETKWSASRDSRYTLRRAIPQARQNARAIRLRLQANYRSLPVEPTIVLWGPHTPHDLVSHADGVVVLHGSALTEWLRTLPQDRLTSDEVTASEAGLRRYVDQRRVEIEDVSRFVEAGISGVFNDITVGVLTAFGTVILIALTFQQLPAASALAVTALLGCAGVAARLRWRSLRIFGLGIASAAGTMFVLAVFLMGTDLFT